MDVDGLKASGASLFEALTSGRQCSAAHLILIKNAARIADRLDEIEAELPASPLRLTTTNHLGTESINPLVSEQRQQLAALSGLLVKLGVSELPAAVGSGPSLEQIVADQLAKKRAEKAG